MSGAVDIIKGVAGGAIGLLLQRGAPKRVAALPKPTVNEARLRADESDRLARRTGTGANSRVDFGAGEAMTGPKKSLLGRGG